MVPPIVSGSTVTAESLKNGIANARDVHIATHGFLDSTDPGRSYLLMAYGQRFSVADAANLNLSHSPMVLVNGLPVGFLLDQTPVKPG